MNNNEIETLAKQHLSIWSEKNPEKRNALIKIVYAEDVNIIDPFFESEIQNQKAGKILPAPDCVTRSG
jgi:hypothetical protein